jgi:carbon monoxide dehydrogenase subunit G
VQHEHTEHVAAPPDAVYAAIADVTNLPRFVPQVIAARAAGANRVEVDARYEGHEQHGEASFATDDAARRIEWGQPPATAAGCRSTRTVKALGSRSSLTLRMRPRAITMSRRR